MFFWVFRLPPPRSIAIGTLPWTAIRAQHVGHAYATGGLAEITIPASASAAGRVIAARTPLLPLTFDGARPPARGGPPALGADNAAVLRELGYLDDQIAMLQAERVVANAPAGAASAIEAASS